MRTQTETSVMPHLAAMPAGRGVSANVATREQASASVAPRRSVGRGPHAHTLRVHSCIRAGHAQHGLWYPSLCLPPLLGLAKEVPRLPADLTEWVPCLCCLPAAHLFRDATTEAASQLYGPLPRPLAGPTFTINTIPPPKAFQKAVPELAQGSAVGARSRSRSPSLHRPWA